MRQADRVTSPMPWSPPDAAPSAGAPAGPAGPQIQPPGRGDGLPAAGPPAAGAVNFAAGVPLGGVVPVADEPPARSERRELLLATMLLVAAVVAGASSLMAWRDFGQRFGATAVETGWVRPDGSMGRGWLFVGLGVLLALAGVLVAGGRTRAGRILASATGTAMVLVAIAEWGLGSDALRTGPGLGLWVELTVGVLVVVAVGVLGPKDSPDG